MNTNKQIVILLGTMCGLAGCSGLEDIPTVQPIPHTSTAAEQSADAALGLFRGVLSDFALATGVLTDELTTNSTGNSGVLDKRQLDDETAGDSTGVYASLQNTRVAADVAARSLARLAPDAPTTLRGRMYAVQGYTEIMLADLFCSGIPLSTINLDNAEVVYQPGSTRDSVYLHAITLFDSTLALSAANDSLMTLARVGKGRALLALGQFSAAAQAVADVADGARYQTDVPFNDAPNVFTIDQIADHEGQVGLAYQSSHDPRTLSVRGSGTNTAYIPMKFRVDSLLHSPRLTFYAPFVVASWVEARLIQAEAALQANDTTAWLQTLNHIRAPKPTLPLTPEDSITLPPLTDPHTPAARVDTMFAERAAWLYLTGHRQGDSRRLIRQYGRAQNQVYPSGVYALGGMYGSSVTAPIPLTERVNPEFRGCLDREP